MRRRLGLALGVICLLGAGLLFVWGTPRDRINLENFAKIQKGMSVEEIQ